MKKVKLIMVLTFSLGLLVSFGTIKKGLITNAGWAIGTYIDGGGGGATAFLEGALGTGGAWAGAQLGAECGAWGGPIGAIIGGGIGAL